MQLDMHYYSVLYLSLAAGFKPDEAYKIAYSSQYVDDAREYRPIQLIDESNAIKCFDPVCTQHMSLQAFSESISDKVFFPFHFVPVGTGDSPDERVITRPINENNLHLKTFLEARASKNPFRLGIALHALADSYSHQYFSGEWSTVNEISHMRCVLRRRVMPSNLVQSFFIVIWEYLKRFGQWLYTLGAPEIGHVKAYKVPDYPHAVWRFKDYNGHHVKRSNPDSFIRSSMEMYKHLKKAAKEQNPRVTDLNVVNTVKRIIYTTGPMKARIKLWKEEILDLTQKSNPSFDIDTYLDYNLTEWKQTVFKEDVSHKDELVPRDDKPYKIKGSFADFQDSNYFQYMLAAKEQRICVLRALKEYHPRVELSIEETKSKNLLESLQATAA